MDDMFGGDMKLALAFQTRGGLWVAEAVGKQTHII